MNKKFEKKHILLISIIVFLLLTVNLFAQEKTTKKIEKFDLDTALANPKKANKRLSYYYFLKAMNEKTKNNLDRANDFMQKAIESDPADAVLHLEYARLLIKMQLLSKAQQQLDESLQLDPNLTDAHKLRARLFESVLGEGNLANKHSQELLNKTIDEYKAVLKDNPDDPDSLISIGKLFFMAGRFTKAEKYLKKYLTLKGDNLRGTYYLTLVYMAEKKYEKALNTAKDMVAQRPSSYQLKLLEADILQKMGKDNEAEEIYRNLIDMGTKIPNAYLYYAKLLLKQSNSTKALEILEKAKENNIENAKIYILMGTIFRDKLKFDSAIDAFKNAIALDPYSMEARIELGVTYSTMVYVPKAISIFNSILKDTNKPNGGYSKADLETRKFAFLNLEYLFEVSKNFDGALAALQQILNEYPDVRDANIYVRMADIFRIKGMPKKALEIIKAGEKRIPNNMDLFTERMRILAKMGKLNEVENQYQEMFKRKKSDRLDLYKGFITTYMDIEKWEKAYALCTKAISEFPADVRLLFLKASLLEKLKRYKDSEKAFLTLLKKDPTDDIAWNYIGYMLIDKSINAKKGIQYVKNALRYAPKNPAYLDSLGWGYYKEKDYKKALTYLKEAANILSNDPTVMEHMGDVFSALKQSHKARQAYLKALSNSQDTAQKKRLKRKLKKLKPQLLRK